MKGSAKRKCFCCGEFYPPDHRNVRHQRYCSKPVCRKESKRKVSAAGSKDQRTKTTSADRKTASVSKPNDFFVRNACELCPISLVGSINVWCARVISPGGTQALALYLLLVTVADRQGLSFYSDKTAARLLCLSEAELRHARLGLLHPGPLAA
jgi:hypothetical protein